MSVRKFPSANVRPQMSVRKCLSANVRPQMSVRKCLSANVRPQMSVRKCLVAGVPFPSTPADDDQQIQPMPSTSTARCDLMATPSSSKGACGFGLDDGISFKAREALKLSFAGQGHDVWAPTRAMKRLKAELCEAVNFHWTGDGETRAFVSVDVRAMIEGRLQDLGEMESATTKLGLVIGNVDHPNSPKNLSLLGIYFGNDDRKNLENKFDTIFAQLDELKNVLLEIAGRKRTIPVQMLLCADLKFTSALWGTRDLRRHSLVHCAQLGETNCRTTLSVLARRLRHSKNRTLALPLSTLLWRMLYRRASIFCTRTLVERGTMFENDCLMPACDGTLGQNNLKFLLIDAMNDLRNIYHLSRAKILHPEELNSLEHWTKLFYCQWQQLRTINAAHYPISPKLHLLAAHVVPFARSHLWWGLISVQGMEHMHRMSVVMLLGTPKKVVEKLVKHMTMLNALHDREVVQLAEQICHEIAQLDEMFDEVSAVNQTLAGIPEEFWLKSAEDKWKGIFVADDSDIQCIRGTSFFTGKQSMDQRKKFIGS
ncbi:hypothetical protein niasHT_024109 [Heterodera trifolii]|uniref:Uncharacterized protein n=1 Tax=Heterodera trifolii TaxID=157864 RepID=A0ABD2KQI8_9BILA